MSAAGQGVVVTGMGATTPLGGDVSTTWDGLLAGASGTRPLSEEYARFEGRPIRVRTMISSS